MMNAELLGYPCGMLFGGILVELGFGTYYDIHTRRYATKEIQKTGFQGFQTATGHVFGTCSTTESARQSLPLGQKDQIIEQVDVEYAAEVGSSGGLILNANCWQWLRYEMVVL